MRFPLTCNLAADWRIAVLVLSVYSVAMCLNMFGAGTVTADSFVAGDRFRDCPVCPEMIVVPARDFVMGSPHYEVGRPPQERPPREVSVREKFAMALYEIKISEWKSCASEDACASGADIQSEGNSEFGWREWKRTLPVVGISWSESKKYTAWLASKTGFEYRLPSEAEWEHAARGGTSTGQFWDGLEDTVCEFANLDVSNGCADGYEGIAPVGSYQANAFGLYDMIGNVAEWVEDCWYEGYEWAPTDGSARTPSLRTERPEPLAPGPVGDCNQKVYRGGHWKSGLDEARSASRAGLGMDDRSDYIGFRIVRALP